MTRMHLDVLEPILARLAHPDLAAAALVSRPFLAAALPALYAHIDYTTRHAARPAMSPFATLAAHPHLAVHVRRIAVHAVPVFHNHVCPAFLADLAHALSTATNIRAFICTLNVAPPLLPHLLDTPRLHHLRLLATLGSRQVAVLTSKSGLHSLALDFPSWNIIDALPTWSASMQRTLAHLTLFMAQDLDATALDAILAHLPRLRGLHVIGCPRVTHSTVLRALSHTPDLNELSLTIFPSHESTLPQLNFPIPPLTHLSVDVRASYPALKLLLARIIARLSPRIALAICGGWIGEIKSSSEHIDPPQDPAGLNTPSPAGGGQQVHAWQSHPNLPPHDHAQPDDPLLTPAHPHPGHVPGPPNQGDPPPFMFGFSLGNLNGNNNNDDDDLPGPGPPNPDAPSLVASLPSTLSVLHLPLISPAGLKEVVERCEDIQVLGLIIGSAFSSPASVKTSKTNTRSAARSAARLKHATIPGIRSEVSVLAGILARARALQELIIDTSSLDNAHNTATDPRTDGSHGAFRGTALLTPVGVRMLMRESPFLRRIVGEGRVWESPTPTPSSPIPFTHCPPIELTLQLSRARCGPGASHHHAYGPPGFGSPGGGYAQVETENDHWFWLTGSASGGNGYSGY